MHSRSAPRRHAFRVTLLAMVALLVSCTERDQQQPLAPASMRPHYGFTSNIHSSTSWNTYSADVSVAVIAPIRGVVRADSINTVAFHIQRTLDNSNVWTTEMTMQQSPSFPLEPSAIPIALPVRMVMRETPGATPQYFDSTGAVVQLRLPDTATLLASSVAAPTNGGVSAMRASGSSSADGLDLSRSPALAAYRTLAATQDSTASGIRSWIDNVVVTREASRRLRAHLEQMYGRSQGRVGKGDRYASALGEEIQEVVWDPDVGAPAEENLAVRGQLVRHVTHTYARVNDSVWVRNRTVVETPMPGGAPGIRRVISALDNVTVDKRGGR